MVKGSYATTRQTNLESSLKHVCLIDLKQFLTFHGDWSTYPAFLGSPVQVCELDTSGISPPIQHSWVHQYKTVN